jgi:hypothetical protein
MFFTLTECWLDVDAASIHRAKSAEKVMGL